MGYTKLGKTDMEISKVCVGADFTPGRLSREAIHREIGGHNE